jgi:hypothetical protein
VCVSQHNRSEGADVYCDINVRFASSLTQEQTVRTRPNQAVPVGATYVRCGSNSAVKRPESNFRFRCYRTPGTIWAAVSLVSWPDEVTAGSWSGGSDRAICPLLYHEYHASRYHI